MSNTFKVKITKTSSNKNSMRSDSMEGFCLELPVEGKVFVVFGEGLDFGTRVFNTSLIQSVERESVNGKWFFYLKTLNSTYTVELLETPSNFN